jgi:phospholipid transport system substrate-binding protein
MRPNDATGDVSLPPRTDCRGRPLQQADPVCRVFASSLKALAVAAAAASVFCSPLLAQAPADLDPADPVDVVASLHAALVSAAASGQTRDERFESLLPVVRLTHDLPYIAELTIRRQWRELSPAERDSFVAAFERLSVMTYASRFSGVGADSFTIEGSDALDENRVEVRASIGASEAERVSLDYVLQRRDTVWRIVNILADGVSDLALKRAQYQGIFRDGGSIETVIDEISGAADRL